MPGYEVYAPDGTLVLRINRGDYSAIKENDLKDTAILVTPTNESKVPIDKINFAVKEFDPEDFEKRREESFSSLDIMKSDGSTEKYSTWVVKLKSMMIAPIGISE